MTYSTLIFVLALLGTAGVLCRTISDHQAKILAALGGDMPPPDAIHLGRAEIYRMMV